MEIKALREELWDIKAVLEQLDIVELRNLIDKKQDKLPDTALYSLIQKIDDNVLYKSIDAELAKIEALETKQAELANELNLKQNLIEADKLAKLEINHNLYALKDELAQAKAELVQKITELVAKFNTKDELANVFALKSEIINKNEILTKPEANAIYATKNELVLQTADKLTTQTAEQIYLKKIDKPDVSNLVQRNELNQYLLIRNLPTFNHLLAKQEAEQIYVKKANLPNFNDFLTEREGDLKYALKTDIPNVSLLITRAEVVRGFVPLVEFQRFQNAMTGAPQQNGTNNNKSYWIPRDEVEQNYLLTSDFNTIQAQLQTQINSKLEQSDLIDYLTTNEAEQRYLKIVDKPDISNLISRGELANELNSYKLKNEVIAEHNEIKQLITNHEQTSERVYLKSNEAALTYQDKQAAQQKANELNVLIETNKNAIDTLKQNKQDKLNQNQLDNLNLDHALFVRQNVIDNINDELTLLKQTTTRIENKPPVNLDPLNQKIQELENAGNDLDQRLVQAIQANATETNKLNGIIQTKQNALTTGELRNLSEDHALYLKQNSIDALRNELVTKYDAKHDQQQSEINDLQNSVNNKIDSQSVEQVYLKISQAVNEYQSKAQASTEHQDLTNLINAKQNALNDSQGAKLINVNNGVISYEDLPPINVNDKQDLLPTTNNEYRLIKSDGAGNIEYQNLTDMFQILSQNNNPRVETCSIEYLDLPHTIKLQLDGDRKWVYNQAGYGKIRAFSTNLDDTTMRALFHYLKRLGRGNQFRTDTINRIHVDSGWNDNLDNTTNYLQLVGKDFLSRPLQDNVAHRGVLIPPANNGANFGVSNADKREAIEQFIDNYDLPDALNIAAHKVCRTSGGEVINNISIGGTINQVDLTPFEASINELQTFKNDSQTLHGQIQNDINNKQNVLPNSNGDKLINVIDGVITYNDIPQVNLTSVENRIQALENQPAFDSQPLQDKDAELERRIQAVETEIPNHVQTGDYQNKVSQIENRIQTLENQPAPAPFDDTALNNKNDEQDARIQALEQVSHSVYNDAQVQAKLTELDTLINQIKDQLNQQVEQCRYIDKPLPQTLSIEMKKDRGHFWRIEGGNDVTFGGTVYQSIRYIMAVLKRELANGQETFLNQFLDELYNWFKPHMDGMRANQICRGVIVKENAYVGNTWEDNRLKGEGLILVWKANRDFKDKQVFKEELTRVVRDYRLEDELNPLKSYVCSLPKITIT